MRKKMKCYITFFLMFVICFYMISPINVYADNMDGIDFGDIPDGQQFEEYKKLYGWNCENGKCTSVDGKEKLTEDELKQRFRDEGGIAGDQFTQWLKDKGWTCTDERINPKCTNSNGEEKYYYDLLDSYKTITQKETDHIKEKFDKPQLDMDIITDKGCVIMGSNLNNLLGDIYKLIRGACIALVVVLGILDFLKAVTSDDAESMKKAGSKFTKRLILLVVLIILPYLIDFFLELIFGNDLETCLDPFK